VKSSARPGTVRDVTLKAAAAPEPVVSSELLS